MVLVLVEEEEGEEDQRRVVPEEKEAAGRDAVVVVAAAAAAAAAAACGWVDGVLRWCGRRKAWLALQRSRQQETRKEPARGLESLAVVVMTLW
jgi:hypothetical protein